MTPIERIINLYDWFKATKLGYPVRKMTKAFGDLVLGLSKKDPRKPIGRNATVLTAGTLGYIFGLLIPTIFASKLSKPVVEFISNIIGFAGFEIAGAVLTTVAVFVLGSVVAGLSVYFAKSLYGRIFSKNTPHGRITNQAMVIPEAKKEPLAKTLQLQVRLNEPRARFDVDALNRYEDVLQERYVKLRELTKNFNGSANVRAIASEMLIFSQPAALAQLVSTKEAMENLRRGNWPEVLNYMETLKVLREQQKKFYEQQQERLNHASRALKLQNTRSQLGEEGVGTLGQASEPGVRGFEMQPPQDETRLTDEEARQLADITLGQTASPTRRGWFGCYGHTDVAPSDIITERVQELLASRIEAASCPPVAPERLELRKISI